MNIIEEKISEWVYAPTKVRQKFRVFNFPEYMTKCWLSELDRFCTDLIEWRKGSVIIYRLGAGAEDFKGITWFLGEQKGGDQS